MTERNFSKDNPFLQTAWDATSLNAYMTCPQHYKYRIIDSWIPKRLSVHLEFGLRYHSALELWDEWQFKAQIKEIPKYKAVKEGQREAILYAIRDDWDDEDGRKNRFNLIRSIAWYTEHWKRDPFEYKIKANGTPAIEESFRFDIPLQTPEGDDYILCGHIDNIRLDKTTDMEHVFERKTTKDTLSTSFFSKFSPDTQVSMYSLAGSVILQSKPGALILDACQTVVNFSTYSRQYIHRTKSQIQEFLADTMRWIKSAERDAMEQTWHHNTRMCWSCDFKTVCGADPVRRESILKNNFEKRVWNPLDNRS